jgi:NADPH:quinone reductase-like Zn-dependent oxidoreductase
VREKERHESNFDQGTRRAGGLEWIEVEDPTPAAGEVIVDLVAGAVNRADVAQRMGLYPVPPGASPCPGLEVSGRISVIGEGVTQ